MKLIKNRNFYILYIFYIFTIISGLIRGQKNIYDFFSINEKRNIFYKKTEDLKKEIFNIEIEISRIEKSKEYAKKILKDKYHVINNNEKIIFFSQEGNTHAQK